VNSSNNPEDFIMYISTLRPLRGAALLLVVLTLPALAAPPSHAPAHGWRKQNDPYYQGYTGKKWSSDYGVLQGRCDASGIGAALGGQLGAEIGAAAGGETGAIIGSIAGVLIGANADSKIDSVDRGCVSHALDLGVDGQPISWSNPGTRQEYVLTPRGSRNIDGRVCRDFEWSGGLRQTACLKPDGSWAVR